jgi:hypothetical protein
MTTDIFVSVSPTWKWGFTYSDIRYVENAAEARGVSEEEILAEEGFPEKGEFDELDAEDVIPREGFISASEFNALEAELD